MWVVFSPASEGGKRGGPEGMDVEAVADPDIAGSGRKEPLGGGEVLGGRHLQIVLAPEHHDGRHPGRLGDRGIIGEDAPGGGAMGRQDGGEMKALRGLRPPQLRAVDGVPNLALDNPLQRVAEGECRDRGGRPVEGVEHALDQRRVGIGSRGVVNEHPSRVVGTERLEAEPHRILALGPARHRRQHREAGNRLGENCAVLVADHDLHAGDPGMRRKCRHRMAQHAPPAEREILLGQRAAESRAAASRDDQGIGRGHWCKLAANCHPGESRDPIRRQPRRLKRIPAFAEMTAYYEERRQSRTSKARPRCCSATEFEVVCLPIN